jgi:AMMECR1 domain-containing protein
MKDSSDLHGSAQIEGPEEERRIRLSSSYGYFSFFPEVLKEIIDKKGHFVRVKCRTKDTTKLTGCWLDGDIWAIAEIPENGRISFRILAGPSDENFAPMSAEESQPLPVEDLVIKITRENLREVLCDKLSLYKRKQNENN